MMRSPFATATHHDLHQNVAALGAGTAPGIALADDFRNDSFEGLRQMEPGLSRARRQVAREQAITADLRGMSARVGTSRRSGLAEARHALIRPRPQDQRPPPAGLAR